ncbi:MAG: hypothetical protein SGILL_005180 [Bacillariaceae sp.]
MQSSRILMGRGSVSTNHGQIKILKHSTPDLVTYIQKAVQTGVYRSSEEIEEMNKSLKENPTELRRIRWNVRRGSWIKDYPKEYQILSLNPPPPFKPRMPVKDQKKMYNKYIQKKRPMDRLVTGYLNKQQKEVKSSDGNELSAEDYYRRLLGSQKAPGMDTAMGSKSATLAKAYAVAVKQYHVMRTENLSEQDALDKVEELLAQEEFHEKTSSRNTAETMKTADITEVETPIQRAEKAFPGTKPKTHVLNYLNNNTDKNTDDEKLSILYSGNQRSFEGMITWTKRLQAVPYRQWTVGASTALDHWIAKRVLGLSEETWLALLEGDSPELMGRGRDIVMARHALFPETILDSIEMSVGEDVEEMDAATAEGDDDIDALLATLSGWSPDDDKSGRESRKSSFSFESSSYGDALTDELQSWRKQNMETPYDKWTEEKKQEFNTRESANEFWHNLRDETSAEVFLQQMLAQKGDSSHSFFELDYATQLERLVNLGSVGDIANEYASEADRSKFLSRYGDYLLEGVKFDHLVLDPAGSIQASDLGQQLTEKYKINRTDRFSLHKIRYGADEFGTEASERARDLYKAWNKLKAGRANYEEKLFQKGRLGLKYEKKEK